MTNILESYLIIRCFGGSITYGTNNEDSDVDIRGIFVPPKQYWLGLKNVEVLSGVKEDDTDYAFYNIRKFFQLALNANPNILEILFCRENHYLNKGLDKNFVKLGKKIIENRHIFLSKKVKNTYLGYALSQLYNMKKLNKNVNQNEKRLERVEKFGYDTKNAMHLIRLLRMGLEILNEGEVKVFRDDARELLEIKNGKFTYEHLERESNRYARLIEESYVKTSLPDKPDFNLAEQFLMEIVEETFKYKLDKGVFKT